MGTRVQWEGKKRTFGKHGSDAFAKDRAARNRKLLSTIVRRSLAVAAAPLRADLVSSSRFFRSTITGALSGALDLHPIKVYWPIDAID